MSSSSTQLIGEIEEVVFVAPALMGGGAERVACTLASFFISMGIGFTFLLTKSGSIDYALPDGVRVEDASDGGRLSPYGQVLTIRKMMRSKPSATFLSFLPHQNMYTVLARLGLRNRVVISVRNDPSFDFGGNRVLEAVRNRLYAHADAIVFQTHEEALSFPERVRQKGSFILNPLSSGTPEPYDGKREKKVAASGRLTAQKNYPMLLRAFALFSESHPEYRLDVFGAARPEFDGESTGDELADLAQTIGISQKVTFHGFCRDANEQIRTSSMFVMASRYEGLSNSMLEALSMGVPTICTRCGGGGPQMVIEDGVNGFLVDVDDVEAMAGCMRRIADDAELAARVAAEASKLRESIAPDVIGEAWLDVLHG